MLFWSVIALLSAGASLLLWRSWKMNMNVRHSGSGSDLALAQIRLSEIGQDVVEGRLDDEAARAARAEEARRILRAVREEAENQSGQAARPSGWWMTGTLVLVPGLSVLIYLFIGNPPVDSVRWDATANVEQQSMDQLVAIAEERLRDKPDDLNGWRVLAPVYLRQNDLQRAEEALRNIIRLDGADSYTYSMLGEILISQRNGEVGQEALKLFEFAAARDPLNATARYFVGVEAVQSGDLQRAKQLWQAMLESATGKEEWIPAIRERLSALNEVISRAQSGETPGAAEILNLPKDEQQARIEGMVASLANRLAENPDDRDGWRRLVRAYAVLDRPQDARDAIASAREAFPRDAGFVRELFSMLTQDPTEETQ